jgi:TATA-box binding protein (TBP) (component of TFIID and TFIIIB)
MVYKDFININSNISMSNNYKIDINTVNDIIDMEAKRQNDNLQKTEKSDVVHGTDADKIIADKLSQWEMNNGTENEEELEKRYLDLKKYLDARKISVSTITLDCKLHTLVDIDNFAKHVILKEDEIVSIKFGNRADPATNHTIVVLKNKKKISDKNFYNQVTILMKPMNNPLRNFLNIKVFKNGSLHVTGCKDIADFYNVITTLIKILKAGKNIKKDDNIVHVKFVENPLEIGIFDVKIRMINSNFRVNYKIDRKKLIKILKKNHGISTRDKDIGFVECKYKPTGRHSCVNIKYDYDEGNKPSIFVFQTGAIIITGAKNLQQIIAAYLFIIKILDKYYDEIKIIEISPEDLNREINKYYRQQKLAASRKFANA